MASGLNLLGMDKHALESYFKSIGEKPFRAKQVLKWIHQHLVDDFDAMTDLSIKQRDFLKAHCHITPPKVALQSPSRDGTIKWLFDVGAANHVETVYIPEANRGTLCISSQVGCALNCTFCSTGYRGFNRNLSASEIIGQLWVAKKVLAEQGKTITNVVMMGMGEPLLNFDNVVQALRLMLDDLAHGMSKRRVTVSTSGVVPAMDKLLEACDVALAVSLHAPNDPLRTQIVPLNKKYPIKELMAACHRYVGSGDRKKHVTIEYVMLKNVNDTIKHAKELVSVLGDLPVKVNLIPFNPFPESHFETSSRNAILNFQKHLVSQGVFTTIRKTRGDDIDAACGQLAGKIIDRTKRSEKLAALQLTLADQVTA